MMSNRRTILCTAAWVLALDGLALAQPPTTPDGRPLAKERTSPPELVKNAKYYFRVVEVNVGKHGTPEIAKVARDLFEKELESRPEFTSDLGGASEPAAELAELKKRGLTGFRMSLRLDRLSKDLRDPKPGGRLKQLAVDMKLSVFGTTFPGEKLAFSGEGEAMVVAEVVEARMEQEAASVIKDLMPRTLKQAVDQAVAKLSMPKSAPMNESKRKRKK